MSPKRAFYYLILCSFIGGCSDDSSPDTSSGNEQVSSGGEDCECLKDEVCFKGECYKSDSDCAKCSSDEVCVSDRCVSEDSPCAKCDSSEVCINEVCVDKASPCASCGPTDTCVNEVCYPAGNPCASCASDQVCVKEKCFDKDDPCAKCKDDEVCSENKCVVPGNPCDACSPSDSCENNQCVACPNAVCGDTCCETGEVCDLFTGYCELACDDEGTAPCNNECCDEGMFCNEGGYCDRKCDTGASCGREHFCCPDGMTCHNDSYCAPVCDAPRVLCGEAHSEVCCQMYEVCLENECHAACSENTTRCGADQNLCCDNDSEICIFNKCLDRGKDCTENDDCALWEFCDVGNSNTCVSQEANDAKCIYRPPIAAFEPKRKWHYSEYKVENTPAVADLNGDGIPEVVFTNMRFELIVLNGDTGEVIARSSAHQFNDYDGMAVADVDNDKKIEIIATTASLVSGSDPSGVVILNLVKDGENAWKLEEKAFATIVNRSEPLVESSSRLWTDIHPAVADIDEDGVPEIVTTRGIIKGNDLSKWQCELYFPSYSAWYQYGLVVADLDQDGQSEIIGHHMYDNKCQKIMPEAEANWGFTAVADLLPDTGEAGELVPEIVRVKSMSASSGAVSVWKVYKDKDGKWSQKKIWETNHPGGGGGHPNIADFNGDGKPEIGIAGGSKYAVFNPDGTILWDTPTNDSSSYRTGSSVFDFEGDGKAEVVYRDQCFLRVYDGSNGSILMQERVTSGTVLDYPLIADIDGDGKTEIITTSSSYGSCGFPDTPLGVIAYEDSHSNWVRTRKIWNQHTYHVTNINDDGTVPKHEEANWLNKRLNNYRANTQPDDAFNAPNFTPDTLTVEKKCPYYHLTANVKNEGSLSVKKVWVSFYLKDYDDNGTPVDLLIGSVRVPDVVAPGASIKASLDWNLTAKKVSNQDGNIVLTDVSPLKLPRKLSFYYVIDDAPGESTSDFFNECDENNNISEPVTLDACEDDVK